MEQVNASVVTPKPVFKSSFERRLKLDSKAYFPVGRQESYEKTTIEVFNGKDWLSIFFSCERHDYDRCRQYVRHQCEG